MTPVRCRLGFHCIPLDTIPQDQLNAMTDAEFNAWLARPDVCDRCKVEIAPHQNRRFAGSGYYGKRIQWWAPWAVTSPWRLSITRGMDEYHNDSILVVLPFLGALVGFYRPGPPRTDLSFHCNCCEA